MRTDGAQGRVAYTARRVARHVRWARTEGMARLVEEDRLDPRERIRTSYGKWSWRRQHGLPPGSALPVFVVGLQRSGTNMLLRGLQTAPEVEVRNENDRRVFYRFRLRPDDVLVRTLRASRHQLVLVKPLCDSYRADELLALPGVRPGRVVWAYRDVDDRARSEVAKFGDSNLQALRRIASDQAVGDWQAERLSPGALDLVRSFDTDAMTPHTAAALFWYLRNDQLFGLGLAERDDVLLSSYDVLLGDPEAGLRELCAFLDMPCRPEFWVHVERRSAPQRRLLEIDPQVRVLCDEMRERLDAARQARSARFSSVKEAP